ncbi:MFS transporter [Lactiplantibacillus sp. WILCCON 0030]|uniref:MFS transporter n=1 Tax=Lactiplantibacillus brownii TaxID=3069269 RepID=A0ABU1A603_9LACO|nr:MFS transporter [Lactiplantibacillus brownii]MDQ7936328.1 MFS transporter [Lactiplantibacillus brownii]
MAKQNVVLKYYLYSIFTQLRFTRIVNVIFLVQFLKFSLVQFAFLQSLFLFSQFAAEIPSGILGDLFKKKSIVMTGLLILTISPLMLFSILLLTKTTGFIFLLISFIAEGVGNALLSGADDALFYEAIRDEGKEKQYGKIRGKMQLFTAIATGLATFLGGYFYSIQLFLPYLMQSLMLVLGLIVLLTIKNTNNPSQDNKEIDSSPSLMSILTVFKEMLNASNVFFMFIFTTLIVAMVNAVFSLLPAYVSKLGFSSAANGIIFMIFSFIGGIVATQAYRFSKLSYKKLILMISNLLVIGCLFQIQTNHYLFLLGIGMLYITVDILDPIVMEMLNLWVKDESRATFISGLSFSISLATMIVNPIIGFITQKFGTVYMLVQISIITILLVIMSYYLILKSKKRNS